MRLLLDTQIFIWWDSEPERLPARLRSFCENPANTLVLSVASVWEMQIKSQLGKLELSRPSPALLQSIRPKMHLSCFPLNCRTFLPLNNFHFITRIRLIASSWRKLLPKT